jgi:hypothetical protein
MDLSPALSVAVARNFVFVFPLDLFFGLFFDLIEVFLCKPTTSERSWRSIIEEFRDECDGLFER